MGKIIDLTGKRFGKLTVIKRIKSSIEPSGRKRVRWLCKCDCGNITYSSGDNLRENKSLSCGCERKNTLKEIRTTHSMTGTRIYNIWGHMIQRCNNPKNKHYKEYGERGINICSKWLNFQNFYKDMGKSYKEHCKKYGEKDTTIDRVSVNGNYEPSNCRWATRKTQSNNTRANHFITYNNETLTMAQMAEKYNLPKGTLSSRLNRDKMDIKRALNISYTKRVR